MNNVKKRKESKLELFTRIEKFLNEPISEIKQKYQGDFKESYNEFKCSVLIESDNTSLNVSLIGCAVFGYGVISCRMSNSDTVFYLIICCLFFFFFSSVLSKINRSRRSRKSLKKISLILDEYFKEIQKE